MNFLGLEKLFKSNKKKTLNFPIHNPPSSQCQHKWTNPATSISVKQIRDLRADYLLFKCKNRFRFLQLTCYDFIQGNEMFEDYKKSLNKVKETEELPSKVHPQQTTNKEKKKESCGRKMIFFLKIKVDQDLTSLKHPKISVVLSILLLS